MSLRDISLPERMNIARAIADYHNIVFRRAAGRYIVANVGRGEIGILKEPRPTGRTALKHPTFKVRDREVTSFEVEDDIWPSPRPR